MLRVPCLPVETLLSSAEECCYAESTVPPRGDTVVISRGVLPWRHCCHQQRSVAMLRVPCLPVETLLSSAEECCYVESTVPPCGDTVVISRGVLLC
ncbi:hypothetical protein ACOMHN_035094 [Nucella lapillus]